VWRGALPGQGAGPRQGSQPKEEEGRGKRRRGKRREEKEKEKKERKENRKRKIREEKNRKGFRKLGEILGKLGGGGEKDFCGIFWFSLIPVLIPGRR
jgi:hypothetical protein